MKIKISVILFFILICFHAQEIKDEDALKKCRKELNKKICLSDVDKDGILFYLDKCPKESGAFENNGCPWPDTDGDAIFDKDDLCPTVQGPAENNGCPWSDSDGDGVLDKDDACPTVFGYTSDDPYRNGCMAQDCKKLYEEGQLRLKRFQEESKLVDYDKLREKIIDDIDLTLFTFRNIVIFTKNLMLICGTGRQYYCPSYYNYDTPVFSTKDFWNEKVILKLYEKLPKNIIFATNNEGEGSGVEYEKELTINKISKQVKIINKYGIESDAVLYFKFKENQTKIKNYNSLSIKISKNDFGNKVEVIVGYSKLDYRFTHIYTTTYQYIDNEWKVVELKKEN